MPSSAQKLSLCTGDTCDVRLCSVSLYGSAIYVWLDLPMVDVALLGPRLSGTVRVPRALHACIASRSAAPFITYGYAAVWPSLCDARDNPFLHCCALCPVWLLS